MIEKKTSKAYWDHLWKDNPIPERLNAQDRSLKNYKDYKFHDYFRKIFSGIHTEGKSLLEIGCARSVWLPYFAKEFGFKVSGLDYSEIGCEQARLQLAGEGIDGHIINTDFFSPPDDILESFDVVISFGVVEHFDDTFACISSFARFLKKGGMLITVVPNLKGLMGMIQRVMDKKVYDMHIPISPEDVAQTCQAAGLKIIDTGYFLFSHFGVLNFNTIKRGSVHWYVDNLLYSGLMKISILSWLIESLVGPFRGNKYTSPYVICVAIK